MKKLFLFPLLLLSFFIQAQFTTINITQVADMPMSISNNAVTEGWANDTGYVYSFGGIDTTKIWSGITLKSFRYNTVTDVWDTIPDLPNAAAVIAAGANYVDSIIYIMGGYQVLSNGNEISSNIVNRFDPRTNTYISDGANIPLPIDDHVQAVWNDSLIYVITGWSNTGNVPNVQIYDPANDNWLTGTSVPNNNTYKAFGASGIIIGNIIYYHGGASTGFNFPGQSNIRQGIINASDPTQITWSVMPSSYVTYRSACTYGPINEPNWLGGSEITYNYNGISYNGSGGVPTKLTNLKYAGVMDTVPTTGGTLPMDLRGVANINDPNNNPSIKYIAGGMENGQKVSDKTYKIDITALVGINEKSNDNYFNLYPNPASEQITIVFEKTENRTILLMNVLGIEVLKLESNELTFQLNVSNYPKGIYFVNVETEKGTSSQKIIIQ